MSQVVDHLAELTGYRDRDVLDVTLVGAFRDLLRPDCVAIYRDRRRCAPLLLADKRAARGQAPVRFVPRAGGLEAGPS